MRPVRSRQRDLTPCSGASDATSEPSRCAQIEKSPLSSPTLQVIPMIDIGDIADEEWEMTFKVNLHAMFFLTERCRT